MLLPRRLLPRPMSLTVLLLAIGGAYSQNNNQYYQNNNAYQNNNNNQYYNNNNAYQNNNNNQNYYYNNNNYNYNNQNDDANHQQYYNGDDGGNNGDDAYQQQQQQGDDNYNNAAYQGDDQYNNDQYEGDDAVAADDAVVNDDAAAAQNNDDFDADKYGDDAVAAEYDAAWEDDLFHWNSNVGFDGVSIMPVSCINYNNGHMIKFEMFETDNSYQCHFAQIGVFVVSISHYMRAFFNHQALANGRDFSLPSDAGYLNCIMLQEETETSIPLYAKVGCMERETFTSTKLQLHVYTDSQCSVPYDDGRTARSHANRGYLLENARGDEFMFSTKVSFRPDFYTCQSCTVEEISETFNKQAGTWYDDDYISQNGQKQQMNEEEDGEENADDQVANDDDQANNDYYQDDGHVDDTYMSANDDIYRYNNNNYNYNGGGNRALMLRGEDDIRFFTPVPGQLEMFEADFWRDVAYQQRQRELYDNNYSIDDWNMCQQVYKYGLYCDDQCRSLDAFRTDRWSGADIILLSIMCTFMAAMMLLIVAKRLKASQKQRSAFQYHENDTEAPISSMPGLPPVAMFAIFLSVMIIIIVLAEMKFVNETLVFAVVTCVLLFIYMLKLTLFASRKPVLLAAPKHDMFDNPLDERLFT